MIAPRLQASPTLLLLPVLLLAVWVFYPGLEGSFVWDDVTLIQHNARVQSGEHLPDLLTAPFWKLSSSQTSENPVYDKLYRPVVSVAYLAQYLTFDGDPRGFHLISLLLHLACVGLVFRWLHRRIGGTGIGPVVGAALGAALFALHPSRPESVSWVSGSTDLWMTLFLMLGLLAWERRDRNLALAFAWLAFSLALLSKEAAVVVPGLLLTDALILGDRSLLRRRFGLAAAACAVVLALRLWWVPIWGNAAPPRPNASAWDALQRVVSSLGLYLRQTFWPWEPSAQVGVRHLGPDGSNLYASEWLVLGVAGAAALVGLAILAGRRPKWRPWLADSLWFFVPLLPVLNISDLGSKVLIGERFLYLPLLGVASILGRLAAGAVSDGSAVRSGLVAAVGILVLAGSSVTRDHVSHFKDDATLWSHQYALDPNNFEAIDALARNAHKQRQPEVALKLMLEGYAKAMQERDATSAMSFALGALNEMMSFTADADQQTLNALLDAYRGVQAREGLFFEAGGVRLQVPTNESLAQIATNDLHKYRIPRAVALLRTLHLEEAEAELEEIVAGRSAPSAWGMLIAVHARQHEWAQALDALRRAEASAPGHAGIAQMGRSLVRAQGVLGRPVEDEVQQAILEADIQVALGGPEAGRRRLAPYLEAEPDRPELVMAAVRVEVGDQQYGRAIALVERAQKLDPAQELWNETLGQLRAARQQAPFESRIWGARAPST